METPPLPQPVEQLAEPNFGDKPITKIPSVENTMVQAQPTPVSRPHAPASTTAPTNAPTPSKLPISTTYLGKSNNQPPPIILHIGKRTYALSRLLLLQRTNLLDLAEIPYYRYREARPYESYYLDLDGNLFEHVVIFLRTKMCPRFVVYDDAPSGLHGGTSGNTSGGLPDGLRPDKARYSALRDMADDLGVWELGNWIEDQELAWERETKVYAPEEFGEEEDENQDGDGYEGKGRFVPALSTIEEGISEGGEGSRDGDMGGKVGGSAADKKGESSDSAASMKVGAETQGQASREGEGKKWEMGWNEHLQSLFN